MTAFQLLVILVPVVFGFMGFAVDLGRLYASRAELKQAANAMALAAAAQLAGTEASLTNATSVAGRMVGAGTNTNRYDFGGLVIGETNGSLNSEVVEPGFYENVADAIGTSDTGSTGGASGSTARHVRVVVRGETPLTFWSFLSLAQERKVNVAAVAVAGISAPLCQACAIEPFAIGAISTDDTLHFGYIPGTRYTFGYVCNPPGTPTTLTNTAQRVPYIILDQYNAGAAAFSDEGTQLYRVGLQGMPGLQATTDNQAIACIRVNDAKSIWGTTSGSSVATAVGCNATVSSGVQAMMCGLTSRFVGDALPESCSTVPEIGALSGAFPADTDISDLDDFTSYTGNMRRVITVPIVDTLSATSTQVVLGFRQFLLEPITGVDTYINPADQNGRFAALYIGTDTRVAPVPLRQGALGGCSITNGPGKVVLHQ